MYVLRITTKAKANAVARTERHALIKATRALALPTTNTALVCVGDPNVG